uniref:Aspartate/glutamate/uridylate kinase domain-containing protein n=1 Tax=Guillardia theta TaxID=55529 RepID=A0A7S4UQM0_GUITH
MASRLKTSVISNLSLATSRSFTIKSGFPVGSARAWLSDTDVVPERMPLSNAKRVVVKVGTAVVSNSDGTLALSRLGALVEQLRGLKDQGRQVILVSSGAVGLGRLRLGLAKDVVANPANVIDRQACAAAGQGILMSTYDMLFQRLGLTCAQVLITQGDFLSRQRYSYLTDTLDRLTSLGVIPIINENDVVTGCHELDTQRVFSDNDKLSALLAAGSDADGLALLTDVEAVFTKPPDQEGAERIKVYNSLTAVEIGEKSSMGRGGMASKIGAARVAALGGVHTVVASGYDLDNIAKVFAGADVGTLFPASARPNKRQRWLTFATVSEGKIRVKAAAKDRLISSSAAQALLANDLVNIYGDFPDRAVVTVEDQDGVEFARGMVQMSADNMRKEVQEAGGKVTFSSAHAVMNPHDYVILEVF